MPSYWTYGVSALLGVSLALNGRLLWLRSPERPRTPARAAQSAPAASDPAPSRDEACTQKLAACERKSWELAARAVNGEQAPSPHGTAAPALPDASPAAQRAALCTHAEAVLKQTWQRNGFLMGAVMKGTFDDPATQDALITKDLASMKEVAALDDRQAAALDAAYRDQRKSTVAAAREAMNKDPPDISAVLDATRTIFRDEDALMTRYAGGAGSEAWRAHQVESRTVLLAMLATFADKDWDETIGW